MHEPRVFLLRAGLLLLRAPSPPVRHYARLATRLGRPWLVCAHSQLRVVLVTQGHKVVSYSRYLGYGAPGGRGGGG